MNHGKENHGADYRGAECHGAEHHGTQYYGTIILNTKDNFIQFLFSVKIDSTVLSDYADICPAAKNAFTAKKSTFKTY